MEKNCKLHGHTYFKRQKNKKGEWWVCHVCLKEQWQKAQAKRRSKKEAKDYQKKYNQKKSLLQKSLSISLRILLIVLQINKLKK